ncbi:hypothetical protein ACWDOP_31745 [Nocardia sp. NPDC003693]
MSGIGAHARDLSDGDRDRPVAVSIALQAIVVALLAGVCESLLRASSALDQPDADVGGLLLGLAARGLIYVAVAAIALQMATGARWARTTLTLGLGVVGMASLLIEPATTLFSGQGVTVDWSPEPLALATFRVVHIVAVLVAIPAMYRAGDYFAPRTAASPRTGA